MIGRVLTASALLILGRPGAAADDCPDHYWRAPYLQSLTTDGVLIVAQSAEPAVAVLRWGPEASLEHVETGSSARHDHVFELSGLTPGSAYTYELAFEDGPAYGPYRFHTLPEPGGEVRLAVLGDSGERSSQGQPAVARVLDGLDVDLLLHTGDLTTPMGIRCLYQDLFFSIYEDFLARTCVYAVVGNHDCFAAEGLADWLEMMHTPADNEEADPRYYSFDAGDLHVAALDTCGEDVSGLQSEWLERDLAETDRLWKIVMLHHPPYSSGRHAGVLGVRRALVSMFERFGVDLVLSGHDHLYQRFYPIAGGRIRDGYQEPDYRSPRGVTYLVTGGGGAPLYEYHPEAPDAVFAAAWRVVHHTVRLTVTAETLTGEAIDAGGEVFDRFSISKEGAPPLVFIRGDANRSGEVGIADAIAILDYLLRGGRRVCLAACDVNGSGDVSIADPIALLSYLFANGSLPPPPFPDCGAAPGADDTGCVGPCEPL